MAKQVGPFKITGCYDNVCFYKMDGAAKVKLTTTASRKRIIETAFPFAEEILYRVFSSSVSNETGIATCFKTGPP